MLSRLLALSICTLLTTGACNQAEATVVSPTTQAVISPAAEQGSTQVPANLFMPPNPEAPGSIKAHSLHLNHLLSQRTTNFYHASPTQAKNIQLAANRMNGIVVGPGQTFSYNKYAGPYTEQNGYGWGRAFSGNSIIPSMGGGVCQGASTLYSAILRTGLQVVERHQHGLTVPYLPLGEDATVSYFAHLDFQFKNNQQTPVLITAEAYPSQRILTVALWGAKTAPQIQVRHRILSVYPYQTIYKSAGPHAAKEHILFPGQKGAKVESWLQIAGPSGSVRKSLGTDTYKPSPRIVERG